MSEKFKISLLKNGIHSFNKGLQEYTNYERGGKKDELKLKESIMFLHHGIELLLKQVLINLGGEYLIFSDINSNTVKKIADAKTKGVSVFSLSKPPNTATYLEVIDRINAFLDIPRIEDSLETRLVELNSIRNNLEHYGIDKDKLIIENLLVKIRHPISTFFLNAGINLGDEYDDYWTTLEKELLIQSSKLRGSGFIKKAIIDRNKAIIVYVENYDEYKKIQPQSTVTKKQMEMYWGSGDAIKKALVDGSIRLLRNIYSLIAVEIVLPFNGTTYSIMVNRLEVEKYLGLTFEQINRDWDNTFSNNYVYSKQGRTDFFMKFGQRVG